MYWWCWNGGWILIDKMLSDRVLSICQSDCRMLVTMIARMLVNLSIWLPECLSICQSLKCCIQPYSEDCPNACQSVNLIARMLVNLSIWLPPKQPENKQPRYTEYHLLIRPNTNPEYHLLIRPNTTYWFARIPLTYSPEYHLLVRPNTTYLFDRIPLTYSLNYLLIRPNTTYLFDRIKSPFIVPLWMPSSRSQWGCRSAGWCRLVQCRSRWGCGYPPTACCQTSCRTGSSPTAPIQ